MDLMPSEVFLIENEPYLRLAAFFAMLLIMGIWETLAPSRELKLSRLTRWFNNLTLVAINSLVLRVIYPTAGVGLAVLAQSKGWGLFNYFDLHPILELILAVVILDLVIYLQHVTMHAVPGLWRLHRVHHADIDFDVTTGSRFHPIEIILSMLIKFVAIVSLGPSALAVVVFEIILNSLAMFNHSNVSLPPKVDRIVRRIIVTPDMHRVHHSIEADETNTNFGFSLSCWDFMLGTYLEESRDGRENMTIGIRCFNSPRESMWLDGLLIMPFRNTKYNYSITRRSNQETE